MPTVIQFISNNLKSSDFKFRIIQNIFKARSPTVDEKSNIQKEVIVLRYH